MTTKAAKFATFISEYNKSHKAAANQWTVEYNENSGVVTLTAQNSTNKETIVLVWNGETEVYNYPESVYSRETGNVGEWTIRNVSEARMIVERKVTKGSSSGKRTGRPRKEVAAPAASETDNGAAPSASPKPATSRKRRNVAADEGDRPVTDRPFNLDDPDEVIIATLTGKNVTWRRGAVTLTKAVAGKNIRVEESKKTGRRMIHFADDGFYAVYLDAILKVNG